MAGVDDVGVYVFCDIDGLFLTHQGECIRHGIIILLSETANSNSQPHEQVTHRHPRNPRSLPKCMERQNEEQGSTVCNN